MNLASIIAILGMVNTLLTIVKDVPEVIQEIKSLMDKVEPWVATGSLSGYFETLKTQIDKL